MRRLLPLLLLVLHAGPSWAATTYYVSPSGSDAANGLSTGTAWKTFSHAFTTMAAADTLYLMNGTYSVAAGTGVIDPNGTNSAMPPSGASINAQTMVLAINAGEVDIIGYGTNEYTGTPLRLGSGVTKTSYVTIDGITFKNNGTGTAGTLAGWLYNTSYITIRNCGFVGSFSIGTNDHANGNTRNLIQDVWVAAARKRIIVTNYRSHENVWRRVVVRGDGCSDAFCTGSGNPNVGITVYESHDVSLQNVIVIDRILGGGEEYSDFASVGGIEGDNYLARSTWLGCISLSGGDGGFWWDSAGTSFPEVLYTARNCIAWDNAGTGFNVSHGTAVLENLTVGSAGTGGIGDGVRLAPEVQVSGSSVTNIEIAGVEARGINSVVLPTYCNVFGAPFPYTQTTCVTGATSVDALNDTPKSIKFIPRIESDGATLHGTGAGGADKGANIIYRYGTENTRFGDSGYNTLTATALWPWPNQARIKQEMCTDLSITRGFCAGGLTLTGYIWNYLGNGSPYEGGVVTVETTSLPNGTVGQSYAGTACLSATGGLGAPFTWSVTAGTEPTGVTVGSDGCWTAEDIPSVANTFNFTVQACDATPTCDTQAEAIIITAAPTVDVVAMPGSNYIVVRFGKAGLPYSDSCDAVVKIGEATQGTFTSTSGPSRRTLALTSLTASTAYNIDITCTSASANRATSTTLATPSGGARTVSIALGDPSSILPTAARVTVEYDDNEALSTPATAQDTNGADGFAASLSLTAGLYYWRHKWQTAADVVLATGAVQALLVP